MKINAAGAMLISLGLATATWLAAAPATEKKGSEPAVAAKAPEPAPVIEGIEIARASGTGFLGLQVVNNNFVLSFYTAEKKKTAPDVNRASVRWPVKYQPNDERASLTPGSDGTSLSSTKTVRAPHVFKVYLSLFGDEQEQPVETYVVDYRE